MKILCVGGGSGGHITPIAAVANEILNREPKAEIRVWTDKKFFASARQLFPARIRVDKIASGKLRRYANLNFFYKYFSWFHITTTHLPNLRDSFKIFAGFVQSFAKLLRWRPNVIFCKGGFVCLPVGFAAHLLKIPLVIHDSDTVPGLTNKILAGFAAAIGTGAPTENYPNYPKSRTKFVGIPVRPEIQKSNPAKQLLAKQKLGFDDSRKLIFVFGGGLGATALNEFFATHAREIIADTRAQILLGTGKGKSFSVDDDLKNDFRVREFISAEYADVIAAADLVVTRAGATTLAELAIAAKATIIVPSPYLAGDHQTKNAAVYARANAAIVLNQKDIIANPSILTREIAKVLRDDKLRAKLGKNLAKFAKTDSLKNMVDMILRAAKS